MKLKMTVLAAMAMLMSAAVTAGNDLKAYHGFWIADEAPTTAYLKKTRPKWSEERVKGNVAAQMETMLEITPAALNVISSGGNHSLTVTSAKAEGAVTVATLNVGVARFKKPAKDKVELELTFGKEKEMKFLRRVTAAEKKAIEEKAVASRKKHEARMKAMKEMEKRMEEAKKAK